VESEYGHGTAFTVTIPIVGGSEANIRKHEEESVAYALRAPGAKILITDDNEFNLRVASGLLQLMEIDAEMADSGFKAIEMVQQNDYDIVFMDHMMPEMDGIEALHEIRALGGKHENTIIIALTANAANNARLMFLQQGFDDFISKPINADELCDILRRYLPADLIRAETSGVDRQAYIDGEEKLRRKSIVTFVKENRDAYGRIVALLDSGDIKTAHRIAHTLKSAAGYLEKKALQEAAFSLEESLKGDTAGHTPQQLSILEKELSSALNEFELLLEEAGEEKTEAMQIDDGELAALLQEIEPLLRKNDFAALDHVEKLRGVAGMQGLAELIDDYDFTGALKFIESL